MVDNIDQEKEKISAEAHEVALKTDVILNAEQMIAAIKEVAKLAKITLE